MAIRYINATSRAVKPGALFRLALNYNDLGSITHVWGDFGCVTKQDAIDDIVTGRHQYFVNVGLYTIPVEAIRKIPVPSTWYLKTVPDATTTDNLLSLPVLPAPVGLLSSFG